MKYLYKEEIARRKEIVLKNIKWEVKDPYERGGQSVGVMPKTVTLISDDLDVKISIGYERSQIRNKETALLIFDLVLEDILSR